MPKKPTKYGIKAFTLAESEQGYILDILVYTGSDTLAHADSRYDSLPQPARVVMDVTAKYLDRGHRLFVDRYYTSIPLAHALADRSTGFTGTAMRNRVDLPDEIRSKSFRLSDGEVQAYRTEGQLALGWRAAKKKTPVIMLSSEGESKLVRVVSRATQTVQLKPKVIDEYNYSMNGVDKADQYAVYYSFIRKSRKRWRKLFYLAGRGNCHQQLYSVQMQYPITHDSPAVSASAGSIPNHPLPPGLAPASTCWSTP